MSLNLGGTYRQYGSAAFALHPLGRRPQVSVPSLRAGEAPELPWRAQASVVGAAKLRWNHWDTYTRAENPLSRPLDALLAAILLVCFAPLFVLVSLAVWLDSPGPIFFAHRRVGRKGRNFLCYKFRSMHVGAERRLEEILRTDPALRQIWERDQKLPNDPRVTRLGKFLRVTSLDELPQLFNVVRGDMSLVGPRPIVRAEVARYGQYIHHYYAVRPGITGLWQVVGRSSVTYRRRVAADVKYARARTLGLDLRILAATIPAVSMGRGSC